MRRLADHFRATLPEPATAPAVAAESEHGRPPLQHGRYGDLPVWFHAAPATAGMPRTNDGVAFDPDDAITCLQFEHYVAASTGAGTAGDRRLQGLYYLLKPLLPRAAQVELQRANARRRLRTTAFPGWPQDATLTALMQALLVHRMEAAKLQAVPFVGFWPRGKHWAWCLSHDVDTAAGVRNVEAMAQAEEARGVRSAWYFVPERYPLTHSTLDALRARGHEIGVHGLEHTGKLFASRAHFAARRDRINQYIQDWGACGFRSPFTYRNPFWLPELNADYDSSFMDNATLEPQPGGVCGAFPFLLNDRMVELPITLPMDHTLINVLRQDVVAACRSKLDWVRAQHGLAMLLFHPDYNTSRDRLERYATVIDAMRDDPAGWYALPHEIAAWWQKRRASRVIAYGGSPYVDGPAAEQGSVWWAYRDERGLRIVTA